MARVSSGLREGGRLAGKGGVGRRALGKGTGKGRLMVGRVAAYRRRRSAMASVKAVGSLGVSIVPGLKDYEAVSSLRPPRGVDAAFNGRRLEGALVKRDNFFDYCSCGLPPSPAYPHL